MDNEKKLLSDLRPPLLVILSILSQILIIPWSNQRIRNWSRSVIKRTFWLLVHSTADYFATLSIWFIFHVYMDHNDGHEIDHNTTNKSYLAFWAPFTLLHLGRHSKITAFSLQDNHFWPKQAIGFIIYECTTLFICILAPIEAPTVWPSIIVFTVGTIKFGERIWSLNHGSIKRLNTVLGKPDSGLDINQIANKEMPTLLQGEPRSSDQYEINLNSSTESNALEIHSSDRNVISLCKAYKSFSRYKGLYADVRFTSIITRRPGILSDISVSCLEIELDFAHDLFYSKSVVSHTLIGFIVRVLTTVLLIILAVVLFVYKDHHQHRLYTIFLPIITFLLEVTGLFNDATSKWTLVKLGFHKGDKWRKLERWILNLRPKMATSCTPSFKIGQHSVLRFCSKDYHQDSKLNQLLYFFEIKEFWDNVNYTSYVPFNDHLKTNILAVIETRFLAEWEVMTATKNPVLKPLSLRVAGEIGCDINFNVIRSLEIGEAIIVWHLATELCYGTLQATPDRLKDAKLISDYMLYLVVECPVMLSSVLKPDNCYIDACAAVRKFIAYEKGIGNCGNNYYDLLNEKKLILQEQDANNLLWYGFEIASKLMARTVISEGNQAYQGTEGTWNLLFEVWVNLLSHAAFYCKGQNHAAQLSTGGELLTFVWVFMLHFFMGNDTITSLPQYICT